MLTRVKTYFDVHSHYSAYRKDPNYYLPLINFLKTDQSNQRIRVLDVGCGDGSFIKAMMMSGIDGDYAGIDISNKMISTAKQNIGQGVGLIVSDGLNLPFVEGIRFELIHLDSVLHHIIRTTRAKSFRAAAELFEVLNKRRSQSGVILVEEMYFDSYMIPHISASIIFYILKVLNTLRLDVSRIHNEIKLDLEVNFYSDEQLREFLSKYGTVRLIKKETSRLSKLQRLFLLRDRGHVSYMVIPDRAKLSGHSLPKPS